MNKLIYLILLSYTFVGCSIHPLKRADLRTEALKTNVDESKAKDLLKKMARFHGAENWKNITTYEADFSDAFYGFFGSQSHQFKEDSVSFLLKYATGTFDGQLIIQSGKEKDITWGMQSWNTYVIEDEIKFKKSKKVEFWVPTYHYFIELPSRIQNASKFGYAGVKEIEGEMCDGVMASWNKLEPQKKIDQYLLWINKQGQIIKVEYTVRDAYKFVSGSVLYKDCKRFNGILIPQRMPVGSNLVKEGYLHQMYIRDLRFDTFDIDELRPNKEIQVKGDEK